MEWQIRERGSNEVVAEGESLYVFGELFRDGAAENRKHYICRKGEILVSESELKENGYFDRMSIKQSLLELREEHEKECEYSQRLKAENAALKAELAELRGALDHSQSIIDSQKEEIKSRKAVFKKREQSLIDQLNNPSEPEKEVTRGDEIAELVARIAYYAVEIASVTCASASGHAMTKRLESEQNSAQNQLATIINQGV